MALEKPKLNVGKKVANGSGITATSSPYVTTVTGLSFQPRLIVVTINSGTVYNRIVYADPILNTDHDINDLIGSIDTSGSGSPIANTQYSKIWQVTSNSFSFQQGLLNGCNFTWIAYE
ncbi:hypothetical protein NST81_02005 [Bacillus sp. FSL W8-0223]|uniref:hypothetical protein n=1 Tax=Bacillus sp. FSL W8-0223 TaxID=2954595 RepID=UPI0030F92D8C